MCSLSIISKVGVDINDFILGKNLWFGLQRHLGSVGGVGPPYLTMFGFLAYYWSSVGNRDDAQNSSRVVNPS